MKTAQLTLCLLVTLFCADQIAAQERPLLWENGVTEALWFAESLPPQSIELMKSKWEAIGADNTTSRSGWAGDYFSGSETHGSYLRWSEENGFVRLAVDKCAAQVMGISYGKAVVGPHGVRFQTEVSAKSKSGSHSGHLPKPDHLLFVRWKEGRLLVPEGALADFGDYAAGLGRHNKSGLISVEFTDFLTKLSDGGNHALPSQRESELPVLPPGYERFVRKPIAGRVVAVGRSYRRHNAENEWWDDLVTPVTVNVGRQDGLKRGMLLYTAGVDHGIEIKSVGPDRARGIIVGTTRKVPCVKFAPDDDCSNPENQKVAIGAIVTTNFHSLRE